MISFINETIYDYLFIEIWWDHMEVQYREAAIFFTHNHHHWSMCRLCGWQIISAGSPGMSGKGSLIDCLLQYYFCSNTHINNLFDYLYFQERLVFYSKTNKTFCGCSVMFNVLAFFAGVVIYNFSSNIFFTCTTANIQQWLFQHGQSCHPCRIPWQKCVLCIIRWHRVMEAKDNRLCLLNLFLFWKC